MHSSEIDLLGCHTSHSRRTSYKAKIIHHTVTALPGYENKLKEVPAKNKRSCSLMTLMQNYLTAVIEILFCKPDVSLSRHRDFKVTFKTNYSLDS